MNDALTLEELKKRYKKVCASHDKLSSQVSEERRAGYKQKYESTLAAKQSMTKVATSFKDKVVEHQQILIDRDEKHREDFNAQEQRNKAKTKNLTDKISTIQQLHLEEKRRLGQEITDLKKYTTTTRNKFSKLMQDISRVYNTVVKLNSSTPYRPGQVESVLKDIQNELELVKNVYIN